MNPGDSRHFGSILQTNRRSRLTQPLTPCTVRGEVELSETDDPSDATQITSKKLARANFALAI
jgi:hypothetical protein